MSRFLPISAAEVQGPLDIVILSGDAYVDHPAWGASVIGRWLQHSGYSVGIIAQPDWRDPESVAVFGKPRLFFGVTGGNMDSMVNRYTAARRYRSEDAYSPGGEAGLRPDRASMIYAQLVRRRFGGVPVILGGIEASLRRLVHFDYWSNKLRGSILLDAKADLLVFGMAERTLVEVADRLAAGKGVEACRDLPGVMWAPGAKDRLPDDGITLPSLEACQADPRAMNTVAAVMVRESNPFSGKRLVQVHGSRAVVCNPPAEALSPSELDAVYELPWTRLAHPSYAKAIPALASVKDSITVNRGCAGGCNFCALTAHQGRAVVSRTPESVLREARVLAKAKGFNGTISDVGGPSANMYRMGCDSPEAAKKCKRRSCIVPNRCPRYKVDHGPLMSLLADLRKSPGVKHVYINSGIRHDLAVDDPLFVETLARHHVQGQLSVAPEHAALESLVAMGKPAVESFTRFVELFRETNKRIGKQQFMVPYFLCGHPGVGPQETVELALYMKEQDLRPRQVQLYLPTPSTPSTSAWYSGFDTWSGKPVYVARSDKERERQRAMLFYWKRESWPAVREALTAWGRADLIGRGASKLVPPGPAYVPKAPGRGR
ncbi:MAG: YgiQ family radical SAM protein [Deltaproteobacteria bacterium]|nr:YgiQ family radical SAM protein [Deltaproteobacteria bacterium]